MATTKVIRDVPKGKKVIFCEVTPVDGMEFNLLRNQEAVVISDHVYPDGTVTVEVSGNAYVISGDTKVLVDE